MPDYTQALAAIVIIVVAIIMLIGLIAIVAPTQLGGIIKPLIDAVVSLVDKLPPPPPTP